MLVQARQSTVMHGSQLGCFHHKHLVSLTACAMTRARQAQQGMQCAESFGRVDSIANVAILPMLVLHPNICNSATPRCPPMRVMPFMALALELNINDKHARCQQMHVNETHNHVAKSSTYSHPSVAARRARCLSDTLVGPYSTNTGCGSHQTTNSCVALTIHPSPGASEQLFATPHWLSVPESVNG